MEFYLLLYFFVLKGLEEVTRTDIGKKIKEGVEEAARTAMHSAESVSKGGEKLGRISAFKAISQVRRIDISLNLFFKNAAFEFAIE